MCLCVVLPVLIVRAEDKPKEDPAATRLLADAVAARAVWKEFPGFSAFVEVNRDGKLATGMVQVNDKGKLTDVDLAGESAAALVDQTKETLASVIGHRLPSTSDQKTPCKFGDDNAEHPLGRLIVPIGDEMGSSYRVREQQVLVVNRKMKDTRFTITVIENHLNEDKLYLPVSYVVNFWDAKTDALTRSVAYHHTWVRVGDYDLPKTIEVITAASGKEEAFSLTLSKHKLAK
jgi:hypothetical protein